MCSQYTLALLKMASRAIIYNATYMKFCICIGPKSSCPFELWVSSMEELLISFQLLNTNTCVFVVHL